MLSDLVHLLLQHVCNLLVLVRVRAVTVTVTLLLLLLLALMTLMLYMLHATYITYHCTRVSLSLLITGQLTRLRRVAADASYTTVERISRKTTARLLLKSRSYSLTYKVKSPTGSTLH